MAAAQETLQQSTDSDTTDAAVQIFSLHLHIMDLQDEILAKGIDLGIMKATYDNLYSMAGFAVRLPPDCRRDAGKGPCMRSQNFTAYSVQTLRNSIINSGRIQAAGYFDSESVQSDQLVGLAAAAGKSRKSRRLRQTEIET